MRAKGVEAHLYAGAKQATLIDNYESTLNIKLFDRMVDWGWFYFITKPLFKLMESINGWAGNFGITILILTIFVKAAFFPLANKQYESMARMKKMQPEMARIKEVYKDDAQRQQKEMFDLYKKEKINPLAGCWPILLQIPVFFALYKVLFVTIDMRHAPFFGWIKDLSAPDPTSLFNLFGLLPVRGAGIPAHRHLAGHHGHHHVAADAAEPAAARSHPAADLPVDAADVHVPAGEVPGGPRDLLGLEQYALDRAAVVHQQEERRRSASAREHSTHVRRLRISCSVAARTGQQ